MFIFTFVIGEFLIFLISIQFFEYLIIQFWISQILDRHIFPPENSEKFLNVHERREI